MIQEDLIAISSITDLQVFFCPVGKTKESLDCVDPSLSIADVTNIFGNFVKFTTDEAPERTT